ncbi:sigma-70 family RNA polymerase sigma factor [bacterium]|nr:sigma-70 family RNA polymerase sigma factor [bacterium]
MNRDKFEAIVKEFTPKLFNYIMKFVKQREDAEDVLQSVFIAFYNKMDGIDPAKLSPYLYRACHNNALDYLKKSKREISFPNLDFSNIADLASEEKEDIYKEIIKYAMAELPTKMSLLIEMKIYQKKSYKEITEETGYSIKAIESQLVRAKKKLRKIIEQKAKTDLGIML